MEFVAAVTLLRTENWSQGGDVLGKRSILGAVVLSGVGRRSILGAVG